MRGLRNNFSIFLWPQNESNVVLRCPKRLDQSKISKTEYSLAKKTKGIIIISFYERTPKQLQPKHSRIRYQKDEDNPKISQNEKRQSGALFGRGK